MKDKRGKIIAVPVTDIEKAEIERHAKASHLTTAAYIRLVLLYGKEVVTENE